MRTAAIILLSAIGLGACTKLPKPRSEAEALFQSRCANCHRLPDPTDYSSAKWPRMLDKMRNNAGLSEHEYSVILDWLRANSASGHP